MEHTVRQPNFQKVEPKISALKEELYIGNLHDAHGNNQYWTMFVSTSPTDVVPPSSISRVTYYLHPTFQPNMITVFESPFYLSRIGWGYFEVKADIIFKNDTGTDRISNSEPLIRASHSIHFGCPLVSHHVQSNLPYVVDALSLQNAVIQQRKLNDLEQELKRERERAEAVMTAIGASLADLESYNEEDGDHYDCITKQFIPEIAFTGFSWTPQSMSETLTAHLDPIMPQEVIDMIVAYACMSSIGPDDTWSRKDLLKTRIVVRNCFSCQLAVFCPVLELVVINCGGCEIQYSNIKRTVRVYKSTSINLYNKGECSSYRFEKCQNIKVEALDVRKRVIFMSLWSESLCFKMFNAYFPNDASKCVAQFDDSQLSIPCRNEEINDVESDNKQDITRDDTDDNVEATVVQGGVIDGWKKWFVQGNEQCYLTIFRKDKDLSDFGGETFFPIAEGSSLMPFI
eukprot:371906_1